ncbi:hypothetical protein BZG36_05674, partial [Bifiguratus adelaidae]
MRLATTLSLALFASSLVSASVIEKTKRKSNGKRYVVADNDWLSTGYIPILLAVDSDVELLAVTSVTGNTWQHECALHALAALEIGNLSCIPVIEGAIYPLINTANRFQAWETVHGALPWQGVFAPYNATAEALGADPTSGTNPNRVSKNAFLEGFPNITAVEGKKAATYMVEMVNKYPGQVSIYAAGAMTNVALAVRLDDNFARLAKELVIMGGYVDDNMYQATGTLNEADINSDLNLMIDPEAAKIAITAPFPSITVVGNVANQVIPSQEFLDDIYKVKNHYTTLMYEYYGTMFPFWDETAMALLIDPTLATNTSVVYMDVDTAYGSPNYGNAHVYQKAYMPPNVRAVNYVNTIDAERFKAMIKHAVQHPKTCADLKENPPAHNTREQELKITISKEDSHCVSTVISVLKISPSPIALWLAGSILGAF